MPTVLMSGANRGLGLEFARQYLADGWQVLATCRHPGSAKKLAELGRDLSGRLTILPMDVTNDQSVCKAAQELDGVAIDVVLNNAGTSGMRGQTTGSVDYKNWNQVIDVNTFGPLRVIEAFADHIARGKRKIIVTITSGMGSLAENTYGGSIAYRSSKAAVNMVMRSVAADLAPRGIICVVINPGWVKTDMGGQNAPLSARDSVAAIRRLIEGLGRNASGKFFNHDGREHPW